MTVAFGGQETSQVATAIISSRDYYTSRRGLLSAAYAPQEFLRRDEASRAPRDSTFLEATNRCSRRRRCASPFARDKPRYPSPMFTRCTLTTFTDAFQDARWMMLRRLCVRVTVQSVMFVEAAVALRNQCLPSRAIRRH